jgi:uncharacterized protein (TIGR02996 family)
MPTHADFLQTIASHPEEDVPRLIYADWLEEEGDSARAEFIRVQCELAHVPDAEPRRVGLEWRQNQLLLRHCQEWLTALPVQPPWRLRNGSFYQFERGFLTALCVRAQDFLDLAPALFTAAPLLRHLRLKNLDEGLQPRLFRSPYLAQLTVLDLSYERLEDRLLEILADTCPPLENLQELYLSGNSLTSYGAETLAQVPTLARLTLLDMAYNQITDPGALALARSTALARLGLLRLDRNPIGWEMREHLRWLLLGRGCQFSCEQPEE